MKKILLSLMLVMSVGVAIANDVVDTTNLTDEQKAKAALYIAQMAKENPAAVVASSSKTVEVVKQWADIGTAIGSGLASSAKQLGIAANDFAQSPVGKFTVFLIAWHFIGATLIHIAFTLLWLLITAPTIIYMYRRNTYRTVVTTYEKGKGPDGKTKVVERDCNPKSETSDANGTLAVAAVVAAIAFFIMMGTV